MPVVLDATLGSPTANSYIDVATAGDLMPLLVASDRLASWTPLSNEDKATLLIRAVKMMETYIDYEGRRLNDYQPIDWPRYWVYGPDRYYAQPSDMIPIQVQEAQALMALNLAEGFDQADSGGSSVNRVRLSSLWVFFDSNSQSRGPTLIPAEVIEKLRGFGTYSGSSGMARSIDLVRA